MCTETRHGRTCLSTHKYNSEHYDRGENGVVLNVHGERLNKRVITKAIRKTPDGFEVSDFRTLIHLSHTRVWRARTETVYFDSGIIRHAVAPTHTF